MGFDFGDIWNPLEASKDVVNGAIRLKNKVSPSDDANLYWTQRGPDGQAQYVPTSHGAALAQQTGLPTPVPVNDAERQALLAQQGALAGQFAGQAQQGYAAYGAQGQQALNNYQAILNGQNSVSAEQLRQALQQQLAQQRSFAAGTSPRNAAGAARTAAIQMGRASTAAAGQQSLAGLQERNQAAVQYGNLIAQLRGQDLNAALQGRQNAESGYGAGMTGTPQPSWIQQYGPAIVGGISAIGTAASDRRLKTDIRDGSDVADQALKGLGAYVYKYKDPKYGDGEQLGQMAQDLEQTPGLRHAVIDTPQGKMVNGAKLAAALAAMMPGIDRRLSKLEGKGKAT